MKKILYIGLLLSLVLTINCASHSTAKVYTKGNFEFAVMNSPRLRAENNEMSADFTDETAEGTAVLNCFLIFCSGDREEVAVQKAIESKKADGIFLTRVSQEIVDSFFDTTLTYKVKGRVLKYKNIGVIKNDQVQLQKELNFKMQQRDNLKRLYLDKVLRNPACCSENK